MADANSEIGVGGEVVLVARKGGFGLPTACPKCLPAFLYLRLAQLPFALHFDTKFPDADHIPYVEYGDGFVAFNNEKGGVIEYLKEDKVVDLNLKHPSLSIPDLTSTKAMVTTWLEDALQYELWLATDESIAHGIYFSDLPWPIGKILHWKQTRALKQLFDITKVNAAEKEEEIYRRANSAYEALSLRLGDQVFFFDNRPTDVDAVFLGHALFVLHVLPESSVLHSNLKKHDNLVKYAEHLKVELLEASSSSSGWATDASTSSMPPKRASSGSSSKPKPKPKPKAKKERTEEEKTFRRRAKYFLATQLVAVLVFLSLMGGADSSELDDDDGLEYEE